MSLNILFAFAGAFTVANLYYNHPILNILAEDFGVKYEEVAQIPTVMQAGYAAGLLFLCPLGDLLRRRAFVVGLVGFTATLWLVCIPVHIPFFIFYSMLFPRLSHDLVVLPIILRRNSTTLLQALKFIFTFPLFLISLQTSLTIPRLILCLTHSLPVFTAISFLVSITTVTPQLMLPLVGDLAPPNRRAAALSIVVSGLMLGILVARVLSGTISNYAPWRSVYWMALGLQFLIFIMLWLFMPDYPSTNPGMNYFQLLWTIVQMLGKYPVLVQACITGFFTSSTFTSFWTTLTFLLAGEPYRYTPLTIGLFGLIGIAAMCFGPLYARHVTDRYVPHLSVLVGLSCCLLGICLGTYIGTFNIAGPVLQAFLLDFGMQTAQIANRSAIYAVEPNRRNGVNTAFMVATFCGQLVGTAAGNHIYAKAGWRGSGSASVGLICAAIATMCVRGPWESRWFGWRGGWSMRKKNKSSADGKTAEVAHHTRVDDGEGDTDLDLEAKGEMDETSTEEPGVDGEKARSEKSGRLSGEDEIRHVR